jgi:tetratricopeptide (TPR) repeat protein
MEDVNYIAVNAEQEALAYGLIFHEYAHFLTGNAVGATPVWVSEGLAELYQTFEIANGGRTAMIGRPARQNLELLQATTSMLPVADLIAVTHDSPLYNEGNRRGMFYAESWALVHYLTFGGKARAGQLKKYLGAIGDGVPADRAFTGVFGDPAVLDAELRSYVRSVAFNALRLEFNETTASGSASRALPLSDADAAGYLADLLARLERPDDARAFIARALETTPDNARVLAALGLFELRASNNAAAFPLLEKAAALSPGDAGIQSAYGRALTLRADQGATDEDQLYAKARTVLSRALELEPDNVSTMVTLAEVEMASGVNPARAVALMERAVTVSPGREEYRLMLAQALAVNGDYRKASEQLGVLIARGSRPEIRDGARRALARVADASDAARAEALAAAAGASANDRRVDAAPPAADAPRELLAQGAFVPTLRSVLEGETRVLGTFSAVECRPGSIVLLVDTDAGPVRLAVKRLEDVDFLTYRQDSPGSIACGAQRPAYRVLATFRNDAPVAGANTPNRAVAIELLPDGFTPK